jgi:hypothetical protein
MSILRIATVSLLLCAVSYAQENPLNINATVYTGFYSTSTKGEFNQSLKFVPIGARFEFDGFVMSPDLLSYSVQPELAAGPQASEAGMQGGNGVRLQFTLLRKRAFPLTFHYSNVQVQDVYFGSLSQLSGYQMNNRNKDLGINFELHPRKDLSFILDWGRGSVNSNSDLAQISDYVSTQNHRNVDVKFERPTYEVAGYAHHQQQESNILAPVQGLGPAGTLSQRVDQFQLSARKSLWRDSEIYSDAGTQSTSTLLLDFPIDLATRYANFNMRLFQRRRWKSSVRAGYSSNLSSQLLAQAVGSLAAPGAVVPGATVMLPFSRGLSHLTFNGTTNAQFTRDFGVYGTVERNAILSSDQSNPLNSSYTMATAGVNYSHKFDWATLSGQYGREFGLGSITGQSGTIQGQLFRANVVHTASNGMTYEFGVHGVEQSVHNAQPSSNHSLATDGSIGFRLKGDLNARLGGGWQNSLYSNAANQFRTNGYTTRASFDHPRYQVNFSLNDALSNSLPIYSQLLGLGPGAINLLPLSIIPSDYHAMSFGLHANPISRVEIAATWTHSRQHLDSILSNDFQLLNARVIYQFRKLQTELGYIRFNQVFAFYPTLNRSRFYVRVQRNLKLR